MTGPVTFGDLLGTAREHLDQAGRVPGRPGGGSDLLDVTRGMHALVLVIGRYLRDDVGGDGSVALKNGVLASPWPAARARAWRAAAGASRLLRPALQAGLSRSAPVSERGRHLDAAARALVAGRDLLATHVTPGPDGEPGGQSAWAPAVRSPEVSRVVMAEIGALARQAAALGTGLVMVPWAGWADASQERRNLAEACKCLRTLASAVTAAHEQEPVPAADRELLRAIPAAVAPPRRLPGGTEPAAALCEGIIGAAGRLRCSAMAAAGRDGWSPWVSAGSLRHAAAASVATSHHCMLLLGAVAGRCGEEGAGAAAAAAAGGPAAGEATEAAGRARDAWLRVARALDQFTSDMPGHLTPEAADAQDLALWTGRLAYVDPQWIPATGPRAAERPAAELVPGPGEAAAVVAAVHHASESMLRLAEAHELLARSAALAGRFLVPTRSLPEHYDIPRLYGPALPDQVYVLHSACWQAREACTEAEARTARVAELTRAPSTVLTRARELAGELAPDREQRGQGQRDGLAGDPAVYEPSVVPGPVERSLQMLGVTDAGQVRRAQVLDRAGEQLIAGASSEQQSRPGHLAELEASARDIPRYWRNSGVRGGILIREAMSPAAREVPERQAE